METHFDTKNVARSAIEPILMPKTQKYGPNQALVAKSTQIRHLLSKISLIKHRVCLEEMYTAFDYGPLNLEGGWKCGNV